MDQIRLGCRILIPIQHSFQPRRPPILFQSGVSPADASNLSGNSVRSIGHLHSQIITPLPPRIKRLGDDDAACGLLNVKVHVLVPTCSASRGRGGSTHNLSDFAGARRGVWLADLWEVVVVSANLGWRVCEHSRKNLNQGF